MPTSTLISRSMSISETDRADDSAPLRAVHTTKSPGLLWQLGASLMVTISVFSGIPIIEPLGEEERTCGVCAVDLSK
jgi:hypothetical protein